MEMTTQTIMTLLVFGGMIAVVWGAFIYGIVLDGYRQRRRERIAASLKKCIERDRVLELEQDERITVIEGVTFETQPADSWQAIHLREGIQDRDAFCEAMGKVDGVDIFRALYRGRYSYDVWKGGAFIWDEVRPTVAKAIVEYCEANHAKK